ncbi:MAG TPA: BTAD domain-containing putative transcriptional regulator, partial [Fimbriimonas sp.]|nr:BTAD domain-containing putative transcriptional regulator [Fimbriimonas sp.]
MALPKAKKARELIAYLAIRPNLPVSRSHLAALLWPDSESSTARFNLRQMLTRLRREAGELATHLSSPDGESLYFADEGCWIDANEFRRLTPNSPERAVAIYGGPFLEEMDAEWLRLERAEIEGLYVEALASLAVSATPKDRVGLLRKAIAADPFREALQQSLIRTLAE